MTHFGMDNVIDEVQRRATLASVLPPKPGVRTFVTAVRLSTEKNHARLIKAFDRVHQEFPDTRLVILGSGPPQPDLARLIEELGLASAVNLAGH
jgi:CDP-glycerol glycerophosphotransferase